MVMVLYSFLIWIPRLANVSSMILKENIAIMSKRQSLQEAHCRCDQVTRQNEEMRIITFNFYSHLLNKWPIVV